MHDSLEVGAQLVSTLERVRNALDLTPLEWADKLHLTEREYLRVRERRRQLPASRVMLVAEQLHLAPEALFDGKIDYLALAAHYAGNSGYVPERYRKAAFSKRRTMLNILRFADSTLGPTTGAAVLKRLQLTPAALLEADADINIEFATDVLTELGRRNVPARYFERLGANSVVQTRATAFGEALARCRGTLEAYRCFLEERIAFHEKNCVYHVMRVDDDQLLVASTPSAEVSEGLKRKTFGSPQICEFKTGVISKIPHYLGEQALPTTKVGCVHWGHSTCRWLVSHGPKHKLTPRGGRHSLVALQ